MRKTHLLSTLFVFGLSGGALACDSTPRPEESRRDVDFDGDGALSFDVTVDITSPDLGSTTDSGVGADLAPDRGRDVGVPDGGSDLPVSVPDLPTLGDVTGTCPTAVARARVSGSQVWDTTLMADLGDVIELDGSLSSGAEASVVGHSWRVLGGMSRLEDIVFAPNANTPNPSLTLEHLGTYRVALVVTDERGMSSCTGDVIEITVRPERGFYVELTWETPDGPPVEVMEGSDMDLHLLHPRGNWDRNPWDCYYQNRIPNWGAASRSDDNPELLYDSTAGWGPEIVYLGVPEGSDNDPLCYQVGVRAYSDHDYGPSDVMVKIVFADSEEPWRLRYPALERRQFLHVAELCFPEGTVTRINRMYPSGFP